MSDDTGASAVATGERKYSQVEVEAFFQEKMKAVLAQVNVAHEAELKTQAEKLATDTAEQKFTQAQLDDIVKQKLEIQEKTLREKYAVEGPGDGALKLFTKAETTERLKVLEANLTKQYETDLAFKNGELQSRIIEYKLMAIALEAGALPSKAEQIVRLLKSSEETGIKLSLNDKSEISLELVEGGQALDATDGQPLKIEGFVERYLNGNKHLVKPTIRDGGAGGSDSLHTGGTGKKKLTAFQRKTAAQAGLSPGAVEDHQQAHI